VPPRAVPSRSYCSEFGAKTVYIHVEIPFPQITAAPNQLRRTSSTFHRNSALCQQYKLVAYCLRLAVIQLISSTCFTTSPPVLPARQSQSHFVEVHLLQCTHLHDHVEARRAFYSLIAHASFSTGGLWRRLTTVQQHTIQGGAWLTMPSVPLWFSRMTGRYPRYYFAGSTSGKHGFEALSFTNFLCL
jgi:hypothetical protein